MNELLAAIKIYLSACESDLMVVQTVYLSPSAVMRRAADSMDACEKAKHELKSLITKLEAAK